MQDLISLKHIGQDDVDSEGKTQITEFFSSYFTCSLSVTFLHMNNAKIVYIISVEMKQAVKPFLLHLALVSINYTVK
jgi:hypothetical protein